MDFLVLFSAYCFACSLVFIYIYMDAPFMNRWPIPIVVNALKKMGTVILYIMPMDLQNIGCACYKYLLFTRNAVFQILYVALVIAGHMVLFVDTLPFLYSMDPSTNHTMVLSILFAINAVLFLVSCYSDPGVITRQNIARYSQLYRADNLLYVPGKTCYTCHLERIPRSKHCAVYDKCIHKFDHYCAWTNNCVGGLNQRYFVLFLVSVCAMVLNALVLNTDALVYIVEKTHLWHLRYVDKSGQPQPMDFPALVQTLFMQYPRMVFLVAALAAIFVVVTAFTFYHVFLVLTNQTTNERYRKHYLRKKNIDVGSDSNYSMGMVQNVLDIIFPLRRLNTKAVSRNTQQYSAVKHANGVSNNNRDKHKVVHRRGNRS